MAIWTTPPATLPTKELSIGEVNFGVDKDQIDRIASLPTYRWAKDEYQRVLDEIQDYEEKIEGYDEVLSDDENIWDIYRQEVKALKKVKFDIER